jgi:acetyl-CoA acetyltransferase
MTDVAVVAYCRTGIARAARGALNQTHGIPMAAHVLRHAVTTLYNQAQLETPWDITNVNGGAVALGHPDGMSEIRYLGQALLELARRRRAVVGVCTPGGMATAAYLERP